MDEVEFAKRLPEEPPEALLRWAEREQTEELGAAAYTMYHCEQVDGPPDMDAMFQNRTYGKKIWVTVCHCTECGQDWYTRKGQTAESLFVVQGEDGMTYAAEPDGTCEPWEDQIEVAQGDGIDCPCCGAETVLMREKNIRGGRTKRLQVAQLANIDGYTTIIYWLVEREIESYGCFTRGVPRYAYALNERGTVKMFSHRENGFLQDTYARRWRPVAGNVDKLEAVYADWGSFNNRKCGTVCWPEAPTEAEMLGTTGEKTGIARYWKDGGEFGWDYLQLWRKCQAIENLAKAGYTGLLDSILENARYYHADRPTEAGKYLDLSKAKPNEMLRLTKEEMKTVGTKIEPAELLMAQAYRKADTTMTIREFMARLAGGGGETLMQQMAQYGGKPEKYVHYMEKQRLQLSEIRYLADARRMAKELHPDRDLTEEELWPVHLRQVHDRLNGIIVLRKSKAETEKLQAGFDAVHEKYAPIEWNDGRLAVILPRSNDDLVLEGETLQHCVGGYGKKHAKGNKIILFIRHYRRPERSYYTLNVGFDGWRPYIIQLHGYGNEHHGPHKEYKHTIPKEVKAFVWKWEDEVLKPWCAKQARKAAQRAKKEEIA